MAVYRKTKFGWRKTGECVQCKEKTQEMYDNDQLENTEETVEVKEEIKTEEETTKPKKKKKKEDE